MSQVGGSLVSQAKKALTAARDFAKKEKLISKGLRHFGFNTLAKHAHMAGYGRRRRVRRRRLVY
jgi:hypothetical protein